MQRVTRNSDQPPTHSLQREIPLFPGKLRLPPGTGAVGCQCPVLLRTRFSTSSTQSGRGAPQRASGRGYLAGGASRPPLSTSERGTDADTTTEAGGVAVWPPSPATAWWLQSAGLADSDRKENAQVGGLGLPHAAFPPLGPQLDGMSQDVHPATAGTAVQEAWPASPARGAPGLRGVTSPASGKDPSGLSSVRPCTWPRLPDPSSQVGAGGETRTGDRHHGRWLAASPALDCWMGAGTPSLNGSCEPCP